MSGCVLYTRAGQVNLYQKFILIFNQKLGVRVILHMSAPYIQINTISHLIALLLARIY